MTCVQPELPRLIAYGWCCARVRTLSHTRSAARTRHSRAPLQRQPAPRHTPRFNQSKDTDATCLATTTMHAATLCSCSRTSASELPACSPAVSPAPARQSVPHVRHAGQRRRARGSACALAEPEARRQPPQPLARSAPARCTSTRGILGYQQANLLAAVRPPSASSARWEHVTCSHALSLMHARGVARACSSAVCRAPTASCAPAPCCSTRLVYAAMRSFSACSARCSRRCCSGRSSMYARTPLRRVAIMTRVARARLQPTHTRRGRTLASGSRQALGRGSRSRPHAASSTACSPGWLCAP
jgi:hypothetical protein